MRCRRGQRVRRTIGRAAHVCGALLLAAACAHYPLNAKLDAPAGAGAYRFPDVGPPASNADSLFVCLTFSGGGTRAAALAYGVMEKLRDTAITWQGRATSLLAEVDCISSVSGGSFTAAYYGLFGPRLFEDFRARFLDRDIQGALARRLLNPATLWRLASPYFGRSDLAAELYDETLFDGKTFAALAGRRPFVILNATDLATGRRFEFTQEQFDVLGSDLAAYPVARGVAASSAFPILLTPISLANHPQPPGWRTPEAYENALKDFHLNRRRYEWAQNRTGYLDKPHRRWVHLADGGMSDNVGLRPVEAAYRFASEFIRPRINRRQVERFVVIVVNARTDPQEDLSRRERAPGTLAVAYKAATISMDNYSFETVELMKDLEKEALQARRYLADCQGLLDARCPGGPRLPAAAPLRTCVVEVNFEAIADPGTRQRFLDLPTTFRLPPADIDALLAMGKRLLDESPAFQRLLRSLAGAPAGGGPADDPNCA